MSPSHSRHFILHCKPNRLTSRPAVQRRRAILWIASLGAMSFCHLGCMYGSLACDTGSSEQGAWSVAPLQHAHVGENIALSFILRQRFQQNRIDVLGVADYAVANILEERIEVGPDIHSAFLFTHRLADVKPGQVVAVEVSAHQTRGSKDYMKIRGTWRRSVNAAEEPDELVAYDSIKLRIYQSKIDYRFGKPQVDLDWSTARLVITRSDEKVSSVFMDRPARPGFTMNGPDHNGYYRIQYFPLADQVNKTGTTRAALKVLDVNGLEQSHEIEFDTP